MVSNMFHRKKLKYKTETAEELYPDIRDKRKRRIDLTSYSDDNGDNRININASNNNTDNLI